MKKYELMPKDGHKSFYGKAIVYVDDNGTETLYSYDTKIISKDPNGKLKRFWDGYSVTTGRHIAAFCGLCKKEYMAMPIENNCTYSGFLTPNESLKIMLSRRDGTNISLKNS